MPSPQDPGPLLVSRVELWWLTISIWVGGVFILTVAPVILVPRVGVAVGMGLAYLLFFFVWQPVQAITQRVHGAGTALVRMLAFLGGAAIAAYGLRSVLLVAPG